MKYRYLIIILFLFHSVNSQSQNLEESKIINSKVLNETRDIKVLLPDNYSKENKYIKYCEQNYIENEYFKIEDLYKLKEK